MTSAAPAVVRIPPASEVFQDEGHRRAAAAAERGDVAEVKELAKVVDLNAVSPSGANLLMYEIAAENEVAVRALLEAGADPNYLTKEGASPMMAAGISPDPRWLNILLDKGGDPNLRTKGDKGEPLLPLLVFYGRWENMLVLLDRGADIEAVSPSGQTATLELAALHQFDRVYAMLERGASPTHPDFGGLTVATFAAQPLMKDSPQEPWRRRVAVRIGLEVPDEEAP
jgi:ankyrin repeat protein